MGTPMQRVGIQQYLLQQVCIQLVCYRSIAYTQLVDYVNHGTVPGAAYRLGMALSHTILTVLAHFAPQRVRHQQTL